MKAKKLVTLALPIMLLGGCGTDTTDKKADTKVEAKAETKEKVSKEDYPRRMFDLRYKLEAQINEITEIAGETKDKSNDINKLNKEMVEKEKEIQETISKFNKIEPPKEFEEAHKTILKAVDCYSKAFSKQFKLAKTGSITKESIQESKDLMLKGNEYADEGYKPLYDTDLEQSKTNPKKFESVNLSQNGKELVGEWGSKRGGKFTKGLDFKEDGTYTIYDDISNTPYENTHIKGKWSYNADKKQVKMVIDEYVKDGKKSDSNQIKSSIDYTVEYCRDGSLVMVDADGNKIDVVKP